MPKTIDIEEYARRSLHYYSHEPPPPLLEKYLRSSPYASYLDCGCGDGDLLGRLRTAGLLEKKQAFAVDLSAIRIERLRKADPLVRATVDSVETLSTIEDGSIDFVASTQVIEHVDDRKMLDSIARVTKKGSTVYLTTVWKKWFGWYFYRNAGRWVLDPTHVREYRADAELLDLVDRNIFDVLENDKTPFAFPIIDFFVRRAGCQNRKMFEGRALREARRIKFPIVGYYVWEIVLRRRA